MNALNEHHRAVMNVPADAFQRQAWEDCYHVLQAQLRALVAENADRGQWGIVFEYVLPRERGRRPDVLVLAGSNAVVLEFKAYPAPGLRPHVDQVAAYARDLRHYHSVGQLLNVVPVLVCTKTAAQYYEVKGDVHIVSASSLSAVLAKLAEPTNGRRVTVEEWLEADYAPLPSLVTAARTIFQHEPLPDIRRAHSAGIPETLATLSAIADQARSRGELHLALVTGVPGAGKTLVGLQFVYGTHFGQPNDGREAVFLSGNGPLVQVLQYALRSSVFVQDVHGFLLQYGGATSRRPAEHIWVYDEAQRAWDAERVRGKRGHYSSEPEDFLRLGRRMDSWAVMVGLIGEGQEIHIGEEAGLVQWNEAIRQVGGRWTVHCPARVAGIFDAAAAVVVDERLDLTVSLRSHLAEDVQKWVSLTLDGRLQEARDASDAVKHQGFDLYLTRSLQAAKQYVRFRYEDQPEKRFGLLASSKAKNLVRHGVQNEFNFTRNLRVGPWYVDPPDSPRSCCALHDVATEFACQGLELDFPIVAWGDDLVWDGHRWRSKPPRRSQARDPHRLRVNSYRVLLTRGRDGFVVFVPPEMAMDDTAEALLSAGLERLPES